MPNAERGLWPMAGASCQAWGQRLQPGSLTVLVSRYNIV